MLGTASFETLFYGGGTPSRLEPGDFLALRRGLAERLDLSRVQEVTLEANPEDFDSERLEAWRGGRVTRLSIGIQSLEPVELSRLGRTLVETLTTINDLEERGIMAWSLSPNEAFTRNEDKSIRQLLVTIIAWVAQRERENLVERTRAGLDRARAEGKTLGRPRKSIEWSRVEELRAEGRSWSQVARAINRPVMSLYRRRKTLGRA
jgi:hypothetical protein